MATALASRLNNFMTRIVGEDADDRNLDTPSNYLRELHEQIHIDHVDFLFANQLADIQTVLSPYFTLDDSILPNLNPSVYDGTDITFNGAEVTDYGFSYSGNPNATDRTIITNIDMDEGFVPPAGKWHGGGAGSDYILNFSGGIKTLSGGMAGGVYGNDVLVNIGEGTSSLLGSNGNDYLLNMSLGSNTLSGSAGNDILVNIGSHNDYYNPMEEGYNALYGGTGDDILINYGEGTNHLEGNEDDDILVNLYEAATMEGGSGEDTLFGWTGNETMDGGSENDILIGGGGHNTLDGGAGTDTAVFAGNYGDYQFTEETIDGTTYTVVDAKDSSSTDSLTSIELLEFADQTVGIDVLNNHGETLIGDDGHNILVGGDRNDTLNGGLGNDTLTGGQGTDTFHLNGGLDTIADFNGPDSDQIEVDRSVFGDDVIGTAYNANTGELSVVHQTVKISYKRINYGFGSVRIPQFQVSQSIGQAIAVLDNPVGFDASSDVALV